MAPATLELRLQSESPSPVAAAPESGRSAVLARLRDRSAARPRFDPGLAGGMRAWLEDAAGALAAVRGDDVAPLHLGPRLLLGHPGATRSEGGVAGADPYPAPLVTSILVHALFRQLVTLGSVGDPLSDALDALSLYPHRAGLVHHVAALDASSRSALAAEVSRQWGHLRNLTPHFAPAWLPRTDDRVAIPLAGGRVVLGGVFDLLVGAPVPGEAAVCAVQLTSGGPWAFGRAGLHYLALLETLRTGSPPFRLALLDCAVGRAAVEDVREEHLRAMVDHVVTRLPALAGDRG